MQNFEVGMRQQISILNPNIATFVTDLLHQPHLATLITILLFNPFAEMPFKMGYLVLGFEKFSLAETTIECVINTLDCRNSSSFVALIYKFREKTRSDVRVGNPFA